MVKTLEEYFQEQELSPGRAEKTVTLTEAERLFLDKHLGLKEEDILERLGMDVPAAITPVSIPENTQVPVQEPVPESPPRPRPAASLREQVGQALRQDRVRTTESAEEAPPLDQVEDKPGGQADPESQAQELEDAAPALPPLEPELKRMDQIQLISFHLGNQEFTIPVPAVQEVIRAIPATQMPEAPDYYQGIVNIRGRVTPVISLASLLEIDPSRQMEAKKRDRFIIVCRRHGLQIGLSVDSVDTIYRVAQDAIEWNIESRMGGTIRFVSALMKKHEDELIGIISLDPILEMMTATNGEP